nr:immunoglobulin light chain junction region [Macaca mulatta]MPN66723.1 immunoglobulin light chain junction region [Macaca mulatta]MPN66862.1 immunoglobulin light chain junction region [Macaca mulatta]MPN67474.1 immunoglobulin light chain junction region [Macaca mulatta]MPN67995.1 immunoglobulin light chain junction region [Macaca mulatta]
CAIGHSSAYIF